jgi:NADPH-dependent 2,4-dienoyl-CoA reductase/sulfur reductase-like enzyme
MVLLPRRNESCWVASAPKADFPRLTGLHDCDVVVAGTGIVGLTAALSLCEGGKSVVVLEARREPHRILRRLIGLDFTRPSA